MKIVKYRTGECFLLGSSEEIVQSARAFGFQVQEGHGNFVLGYRNSFGGWDSTLYINPVSDTEENILFRWKIPNLIDALVRAEEEVEKLIEEG